MRGGQQACAVAASGGIMLHVAVIMIVSESDASAGPDSTYVWLNTHIINQECVDKLGNFL